MLSAFKERFAGAPTPVPAVVVFDAIGSPFTVAANTASSGSHSATAGACVLVYVENTAPNGSGTTAVTYGGVTMTSMGFNSIGGFSARGSFEVFALNKVAGGAKTIVVTPAGGFGPGTAIAVSYRNVRSATTAQTDTTAGDFSATLTQGPITAVTRQMISQAFATSSGIGTVHALTSLTGGTNRYNGIDGTGTVWAMCVSDAAATTTFTAVNGTGTDNVGYGRLAVLLLPDETLPFTVSGTQLGATNPVGTSGCWVTANGSGGAGYDGGAASGGGGGGGGGRIDRVFIPVGTLGPTTSVVQGIGGATVGATGTPSTFTSGSVALSAGAGTGASNYTPGVGGTCSVSGITATSHSGTNGGAGEQAFTGVAPTAGGDDATNEVGTGGGGGGGYGTRAGARGGNAKTVNGGAGGLTSGGTRNGTTPANPAAAHGGSGGGGAASVNGVGVGNGGKGAKGGGGGGGGSANDSLTGTFGAGGDGDTLVEWV